MNTIRTRQTHEHFTSGISVVFEVWVKKNPTKRYHYNSFFCKIVLVRMILVLQQPSFKAWWCYYEKISWSKFIHAFDV